MFTQETRVKIYASDSNGIFRPAALLDGQRKVDAYQRPGEAYSSEGVMTLDSPFANLEQLMRPFELIKGLPASGPGRRPGCGFLVAVTGLKPGLEVTVRRCMLTSG